MLEATIISPPDSPHQTKGAQPRLQETFDDSRDGPLQALHAFVVFASSSGLKGEGFTVESTGDADKGYVLQAKKGGFLSEVISAQRALVLSLSGPSDDATLTIGVGNWKKDLVVTAVETLLVSDLFLPVDIAEMAWSAEVENKVLKQITAMV